MSFRSFFGASTRLLIAQQMTYRANFILMVGVMMIFNLVFPLMTLLIYLNTPGFPGWSFEQILLFQGFVIMTFGLEQFFFANVSWELSHMVREGNFDKLLMKPIGPLRYLIATDLSLETFPEVIMGAIIIAVAFIKLGVAPSLASWGMLILILLAAVIFLSSMIIIQMSLIIRFVQIRRLGEIVRITSLFGQYPGSVYSPAVRAIMINAIPFGLVAFYPASAILGKLEQFPYIPIIAALVVGAIAYLSWRGALRRYVSAGG